MADSDTKVVVTDRVNRPKLERELVKKNLSAHAYPREIEFIAELPKTPSGKIQRFLLRS